MRVGHRTARIVAALIGVVAFIIAMNVYLLLPIQQSFRTSWVPCVMAWAMYRLAWARLSVLRRCAGCGAGIYYLCETCPRCLTPSQRRHTDDGREAFAEGERPLAKLTTTDRG